MAVDVKQRAAYVDGVALPLSPGEFATLAALVARRETPMSREAIAAESRALEPRMVDVHVCRLRRHLAQAGADVTIATVWGRGYVIEQPDRRLGDPLEPLHQRHFSASLQPV